MKSVIQIRSEHLLPVSASHPLECGGNHRPLGFGTSPVRADSSGHPVGTDPTPFWIQADHNQSAAAPRQSGW